MNEEQNAIAENCCQDKANVMELGQENINLKVLSCDELNSHDNTVHNDINKEQIDKILNESIKENELKIHEKKNVGKDELKIHEKKNVGKDELKTNEDRNVKENELKIHEEKNVEKNELKINEEKNVDDEVCNQQDLLEDGQQIDKTAGEKEIGVRVFEKENWQEKVVEFFKEFPNARNFAEKIGQEIIENESLCKDDNCLSKAFFKVIDREYVLPKDIINNQEFRDNFVLKNEEIKTIIIEKYLEELEGNKPPKSITALGQIALAPTSKPKNIDEAGKVINIMFKNRRI